MNEQSSSIGLFSSPQQKAKGQKHGDRETGSPIALVAVLVKLDPSYLVALLAEHRRVRRALFARGQLSWFGLAVQVDDVDLP